MIDIILISVISYFIGAIPFAYIIVFLFFKKDIRREGSRNVGAMNSFEITGKKWIGFIVFLLDFLKGFSTIFIAKSIAPNNDIALLVSSLFAVLGHNYSIYIRFSGGKGLATSAGILFLVQPFLLFIWFVLWLIIYNLIKRDMDYANPIASVISPFLFFFIPESFAHKANFIPFQSRIVLFILLELLALVILSKYITFIKMELGKKHKIL